MGCRSSKEEHLLKIIELSNNRLTDQDIEEIMMNTQFNELELLKLYRKFKELDIIKRGQLTNKEFLNLPELKYNPFRSRLVDGFQLKSDEDVKTMRLMRQDSLQLEDFNDALRKETVSFPEEQKGLNFDATQTDHPGENGKGKQEFMGKKGSKVAPDGISRTKTMNDLVEEEDEHLKTEEDDNEFVKKLGTEAYITFAEFAKYLSLFNPKTGLDEKIQFYFRIFDTDQNKRVDEKDLGNIMKLLFGNRMSQEDIKTLQEKIFEEADTGAKGYLDYDDIQKVLWATNLEHKCSMHFFQS
ncbi:calcineurin b subunit [Stylonychia lemnae]|uniref:Calcineurin b subunit n=1 Tax=Stylonychia lemnae TaxID=5949 RepID=A0A078ACF8_STYLE|nr:calcineurin b subunit [Stylonychia lemnae]|eukprot:CDW79282.1 calcineurin b subunit [Stylonychia lemnae]